MGGDLLSIGVSGLLAFQRGLTTTSHNISNLNTEGYSRQVTEYATREPQPAANGFIGTGVKITTVRRAFDRFVNDQVHMNTSRFSELEQFKVFADSLDGILADENIGLSPSLQRFFNSVEDLADDPASIHSREVMLTEAGTLSKRIHFLDTRLNEINNNLNFTIDSSVNEINGFAEAIASINKQIVLAQGQAGGQPANDLLDRRDQMVRELAGHVDVQTVEQSDGTLNVFIGNGQPLVVGMDFSTMSVSINPMDASRLDVNMTLSGASVPLTGSLTGGKLGAALSFSEQMLIPARNQLGRISNVFVETFNAQHREGMTMNNVLGGDFFARGAPQVFAHPNNTGSAVIGAAITHVTALTADDYQITFDRANYVLTNLSDNSSQTLAGAGPFAVDGLTINIAGAANTGDVFELHPNRNGAASIQLLIDDVHDIAAAAPIRALADNANIGNAQINPGEVLDATDPGLLNTVTIEFLTANTYSVNGAGSFAYTSGGNIDINGWRTQISGIPQVGDKFVVQANINGVGDNRNALLFGDLKNQGIMDGGTLSYFESNQQLISQVAGRTRQAGIHMDAQQVVLDQSIDARERVSGVNLDEEGANLVRLQQHYAAAAQVVAVADTIFQTLIQSVAR